MPKPRTHTRIIQHPFATGLQDARLEAYHEELHGKRLDVVWDYHAFEQTASKLFEREGKIYERVKGYFVPSRVRFTGVSELKNSAFYKNLPADANLRVIIDLLSWQQSERREVFYLLGMKATNADDLMFYARRATYERLPGEPIPATIERDWSPPPPMPAGLVPIPRAVHRQFGGDPLPVQLGPRPSHRRLFIGGVDIQPETRPQVDFVLNVGEEPSRWAKAGVTHPNDRWDNKGEGKDGMNTDEIRREAEWVIERLRSGQRVLVHCTAGMNRSSTICCAVLMLLENLSAEQALARVRETHPWARPDSRHWLALRWLAEINRGRI
jgi:hypothetical protein